MDDNDIRIELKLKNARLYHLIFDEFVSVAAFCRARGFSCTQIGALLAFKKSPYYERRDSKKKRRGPLLRRTAVRLCELGAYSPEDLFPPELYRHAMPVHVALEFPSDRFLPLAAAPRQRLLVAPTAEASLAEEELLAALAGALDSIPPRERQVVEWRYGLNGESPKTLREVGLLLKVTPEYIRQVEHRALRRLRHPSRSRGLRAFIDVGRPPTDKLEP
ncbi:hypothetical protein LLG88_13485 [bacterium]|nr:hypothetical protein [bacterium]